MASRRTLGPGCTAQVSCLELVLAVSHSSLIQTLRKDLRGPSLIKCQPVGVAAIGEVVRPISWGRVI